MNKRHNTFYVAYVLTLAAFCVFASCKNPVNRASDDSYSNPNAGAERDNDDNGESDYNNPNAGVSRDLTFSRNSGVYSQSFYLTLTALEGSTIYYSTDGSNPLPENVGNGFVFEYDGPITIQDRNGQPNVLATSKNLEQMYPSPDDPRGSIPSVYYPSADQVPKATVIRAITVDSKGKHSDSVIKTYFIGDNLANYGNHRVMSLVTEPDNLVSEEYGIMVRGSASNFWDNYNFNKRGTNWERETHLELFDASRSVALSTGVGIRVRGGWSRAAGQKSLNVYFREEYGINNLKNYELIPGALTAEGNPIGTYKSIMLRNGGNDLEYTKVYDIFAQSLFSDRHFSTQAAVPCVVYINGEYWGFYNLQERYSDNHTEYKYGVNRNNVISYDNGELDDGTAADETSFWIMISMCNNDMSIPENYAAFCDAFDIQSFIDYWAAQIFIYNEDWPQNNYRLWRTRTVEPGNPYGDAKWRYQMFDTEYSMGIYNGGALIGQAGMDAIAKILYGESKDHFNNKLFKALLANNDFCKQFVNTMMDLYNVNLHPDSWSSRLDNYAAVYKPLMEGYFERWGRPWEGFAFDNKIHEIRQYLTDIRPAMANDYLPAHFSGIGVSAARLSNVVLSTTGASGATVTINTITPHQGGSWIGKYYAGIPVTVSASAPPRGYEFQWTVTGGAAVDPSALTTTVNFTGDVTITANYKLSAGADIAVPVTGITLNKNSLTLRLGESDTLSANVSPANATYKTVFWTSNSALVAVDANGKITATGDQDGTAIITAATVEGKSAVCIVTVKAPGVLLDFAQTLQSKPTQFFASSAEFDAAFAHIPIVSAGSFDQVTYEIINVNGVKKLEVNNYNLGTPGLFIKGIEFQAGDTIEIAGTLKEAPGGSEWFVLNLSQIYWSPLHDWGSWIGDFQRTFVLTQDDVDTINGGTIRISTGGIEPYYGERDTPVSTFILEQVKITGYR